MTFNWTDFYTTHAYRTRFHKELMYKIFNENSANGLIADITSRTDVGSTPGVFFFNFVKTT